MRRLFPLLLLAACAPQTDKVASVEVAAETAPVASADDAADDPAIWLNPDDPGQSLILGTDKKAGLYVYNLQGDVTAFLPAGKLNNVDLRQGVQIGDWRGDIAAASNRSDDSISLFTINNGEIAMAGGFSSILPEPYGACMGGAGDETLVFIAYKTGDVVAYRLNGPASGEVAAQFKVPSQTEGCVFDDDAQTLYVGEEDYGIWKAKYEDGAFLAPSRVIEISPANGVAADIEGLTLYKTGAATGYLIASSQGNDSYAVFKREGDNAFVGRFKIVSSATVDGTGETDGIDAVSAPLGPDYPHGALVVQDGYNDPEGSAQNFKIVDWREIEKAMGLD